MTVGAAIAVVVALAIPTTANADPVNNPPVAYTQSVVAYQNTTLKGIQLDGDDPDGNAIFYTVLTGPTHGALTGGVKAALRAYSPVAGYAGGDSFTFKTTDAKGLSSAPQTVSIDVQAPVKHNLPPAALNSVVTTPLNTAVSFTLSGSDPDGDAITYLLTNTAKFPEHGVLTGTAPNLTYTPAKDFVGVDSVYFKVDDGDLQSPAGIVTITVAKPNTPPVAKNISATTTQNHSVTLPLGGTDADNDPITLNTPSKPAHGTLSGTGASTVYTPDKWFHGTDSFTYTVSDGKVSSAPATVTIVVNGYKHKPIAYDQSVATGKRQPVKIDLNGWSDDHDTLTFIIVDRPDHGRLYVNGDIVTYVPDRHFRGHDEFDFVVRDSDGDTSRPATVDISVRSYWNGQHYHY